MERLSKKIYAQYKEYPVKVLQFGEGNFLRAFVDWQIDTLNKKTGFGGGVAVVQPIAQGLADTLNEQDGLYTLYLQGIKDGKAVKERSVINCINFAVNPYTDFDRYQKLAESETLRFIISNTTEAGIAFQAEDKALDRPPSSFPGKLTAFLYHRFQYFNGDTRKGCIIIPCELIDRNGEKLKEIVLQYSHLWALGAGFAQWLNTANTFCCSLVDRIVSGYPRASIDAISRELGYEDCLVDVGEQFHLWVIEGPGWIEKELPVLQAGLNVIFTDDLTPYRTRKVRILNGAHTALVPVAYLLGLNTVGESVDHALAGRFLREAIYEEIIPTLELPREALEDFAQSVLERFQNPFVSHYLMSIALNSFSKYKTRVLPSVLEYLKREGRLPKRLVFSLAALIAFYKGQRGDETIPLQDESDILHYFEGAWGRYDGSDAALRDIVTGTLGMEMLWDMKLGETAGLTDAVTHCLTAIERQGMTEAVRQVLI